MGILFIVSTPIGNLEDITLRAIKTLFSVDCIACEDTRKTGQLIKNYQSRIKNQELRIKNLEIKRKAKLISYYDDIEQKRIPEIISLLDKDKDVALVSNAGTPLIADPGFKLVKECIKRNIKVVPIPGPSAVLAALVASGLPTNNFYFLGFLPVKKNKRQELLKKLQKSFENFRQKPTIIAYEAPHRIQKTLSDIKEIFGDIEIVIARELTKIHEEGKKIKISEAITYYSKPKGEFVILFNIAI